MPSQEELRGDMACFEAYLLKQRLRERDALEIVRDAYAAWENVPDEAGQLVRVTLLDIIEQIERRRGQ